MKGTAIAQSCFDEWILPIIEHEFPAISKRIAAGTFVGSQAIGGDDEHSMDHGWGPMFHVIMQDEDYAVYGASLEKRMQIAACSDYPGYQLAAGTRNWRNGSRGKSIVDAEIYVVSITEFLNRKIHRASFPTELADWKGLPESDLYYLRHGPILYDPAGILADIVSRLKHYPPAMRKMRIAQEIWGFWHYGEYNYIARVADRGDSITTAISLAHFMENTMRLWLLLHDDFIPYWKWLHHAFQQDERTATLDAQLQQLTSTISTDEKKAIISEISAEMHRLLFEQGFLNDINENFMNTHNRLLGELPDELK